VSLLYRSEREQAKEAMLDSRVASCVYGAEHLIRLFIKLPELMAVAVTNETQASNVATMVQVRVRDSVCMRGGRVLLLLSGVCVWLHSAHCRPPLSPPLHSAQDLMVWMTDRASTLFLPREAYIDAE
jgi:hypothetical protein